MNHTPTPLNNVCIVQKYNDSDRVLELRAEFEKSKAYIETACNSHDELVEALKFISQSPCITGLLGENPNDNGGCYCPSCISKKALSKAGAK